MTESDPTGYRESPDTADDQSGEPAEGEPTLTTDDDAQHDDVVVRPGNDPG